MFLLDILAPCFISFFSPFYILFLLVLSSAQSPHLVSVYPSFSIVLIVKSLSLVALCVFLGSNCLFFSFGFVFKYLFIYFYYILLLEFCCSWILCTPQASLDIKPCVQQSSSMDMSHDLRLVLKAEDPSIMERFLGWSSNIYWHNMESSTYSSAPFFVSMLPSTYIPLMPNFPFNYVPQIPMFPQVYRSYVLGYLSSPNPSVAPSLLFLVPTLPRSLCSF